MMPRRMRTPARVVPPRLGALVLLAVLTALALMLHAPGAHAQPVPAAEPAPASEPALTNPSPATPSSTPSEYRLDNTSREWAPAPPQPAQDAAPEPVLEARRLLAQDKPAQAKAALDPWLSANGRAGGRFVPEALLLRADALLALDREYLALYDYEELINRFRQSQEFALAVEREVGIAERYANGLKIRALGFRWINAEDVAIELLIRAQERLPRSVIAERASIFLADYYFRKREMRLAGDAYTLYLESFPDGPNAVRASLRRIQCDVARFKGPRYSAAGLINARLRTEELVRRHPAEADRSGMNESLLARLDESTAAQALDTAEWYLATGDEPSARYALRRLVREHPRTIASRRAQDVLGSRGWDEPSPPMDAPAPPDPESGAQPVAEPAP